jgi:GR25 family glycosyltransferase involved in LPS biosynthesis
MKVFVVNAYPERATKYDERYTLCEAVWWENVKEEEVNKYHFRHNAKLDYKKKVVACSMSHKAILQQIILNDLKDVCIIEDDAIIDFDRLNEIEHLEEFCYIGGQINAPLMKDFKSFIKPTFPKGVNKINHKEFRIGHTCGYFIPDKSVAQDILSNLRPSKERAIDTEFIRLQKQNKIIQHFIYPPLVKLVVPEAKKGFTYSSYKLIDDQKFY